ncbi:MAG: LysE family transporter [Bacteroidales bacterium]|jgi:threonine/homoserine/homoserine lactone efflux protein|nr:LysE family transporter [Bacteroidales bacterium]MCK9448982.1 LysE family transporter [Bacteroidales bacterium]MDD3701990.1 LysE family transporter [Bacteroidales bacterium]MDY0368980.1 LysE family transporter [Bacteroidales bacterium]
MGNIIFQGMLLGLTLATFFGFGPAFFALVQTSIHRGFVPAIWLAIGVFLNDLFMVVLCLMGAVQIITEPSNYFWFGLTSGCILIIFGLVTFHRKVVIEVPSPNELPIKVQGPAWFVYIAKGFFMNIVNPFIWIFWVGVVVGISARFGGDQKDLSYFFGATLAMVLMSDIAKAYLAYNIKRFLTARTIGFFNKFAGMGLIGFGTFLIGKVIVEAVFL